MRPYNTFERMLENRSAENYAAFLLPHLKMGMRVLDCGCGPGSIAVGLATTVEVNLVVGVDRNVAQFGRAREYAGTRTLSGINFVGGDAYTLPFRDSTFDAALAHSVLETLVRPSEALREIHRVLKPGAVMGAASVEYGGLLLAGPSVELLEKFYDARQQLWLQTGIAVPRTGRHLRSLLVDAGFSRITASARYISYGDPLAVKQFGLDRARDCKDPEFSDAVVSLGIVDRAALDAMEKAWLNWADDLRSFAAFAWCNAIAWK